MKNVKVCLVPNTHSDLQYLQSYREYLPLHLSNLRKGLKILHKHPEFTYLTEHTAVLEEFWKRFPRFRQSLKRFVREGRLDITPGMYCICDMNIPSGESLIQQVYYGKIWTRKHLASETRAAWIADSFGLNRQMPQILKGCGYDACFFVRGANDSEGNSEFIWEGLDGTRLPTHWLLRGYGGMGVFSENMEKDFVRLKEHIAELRNHSSSPEILLGNGGDFVRPSVLSCKRVKEWNKLNVEQIVFSTPSRYCVNLVKRLSALEVFKGELNPVFKGGYSSRIRIKQANRRLENTILAVEKLAVLASLSGGPDAFGKLDTAWKKLLFCQFHDSINGTIVDSAYEEILEKYKKVNEILDEVLTVNLEFMTGRKTGTSGRKILVFNPLPWERKDIARIPDTKRCIQDENGKLIPSQRIREEGRSSVIFTAEVPSLGCGTFNLVFGKGHFYNPFRFGKHNEIENSFYRIKLNDNGVISSLISKENNYEYVDQNRPFFNDLVMQDDNGDLWLLYEGPLVDSFNRGFAADNWKDPVPFYPRHSRSGVRQIGFFAHSSSTRNTVEITEKGPVRTTVKVQGTLSFWKIRIDFIQYVHMYSELRRIDFKTYVIPSGKHYRIRAAFPTSIKKGRIYHEIPFGCIKRPEGEFPAQNWMAYGDEKKGLVIMNKGLPGNNVTDGIMTLSLMRSAAIEYKCSSEMAFEEGITHCFEYSIIPYDRRSFAHFSREGLEFNSPMLSRLLNTVRTGLPLNADFLRISPGNIILSALRKIDKDAIMVRIYEAEGRKCEGRIEFSEILKVKEISETDLLGGSKKQVKMEKNTLLLTLSPYQIKTFILK